MAAPRLHLRHLVANEGGGHGVPPLQANEGGWRRSAICYEPFYFFA